MQFKLSSLFVAISIASGVLAGQNCKCQAANGQGPQWNDLTNYCCRGQGGFDFATVATCLAPFAGFYPGPNHQCSAGGTNCLNSGQFVKCCQSQGAPSAFCWD
ncbi:hypothetical protein BKA70DRAFT_1410500 [Coprinopsis sp. MPI-PUGE-AT-0042]|nr:hypothetical protein BKA70DRAFT_1410500 [Coprinopsis sp. MPI-PUGE-AT-0042]